MGSHEFGHVCGLYTLVPKGLDRLFRHSSRHLKTFLFFPQPATRETSHQNFTSNLLPTRNHAFRSRSGHESHPQQGTTTTTLHTQHVLTRPPQKPKKKATAEDDDEDKAFKAKQMAGPSLQLPPSPYIRLIVPCRQEGSRRHGKSCWQERSHEHWPARHQEIGQEIEDIRTRWTRGQLEKIGHV
jgi:hypothetical protein